jgi:hypothetical protein
MFPYIRIDVPPEIRRFCRMNAFLPQYLEFSPRSMEEICRMISKLNAYSMTFVCCLLPHMQYCIHPIRSCKVIVYEGVGLAGEAPSACNANTANSKFLFHKAEQLGSALIDIVTCHLPPATCNYLPLNFTFAPIFPSRHRTLSSEERAGTSQSS